MLRKLGLIGGMSWVSTRTYYDHINRIVQQKADRYASAPLLIESLDFSQLHALRESQYWERAAGVPPLCSSSINGAPVMAVPSPMLFSRHSISTSGNCVK